MRFRLTETNYFEGKKSKVIEDFESKQEIMKLVRKYDGMTSSALSNLSMLGNCIFEHNGLVKQLEIRMIGESKDGSK